ncbi:MAG: hypothetical protein JNL11_09480 [Bdellovibrionaceae bacterium]|nr:hypothetical protein [Pseudobdellovibrionaceae bacterium]
MRNLSILFLLMLFVFEVQAKNTNLYFEPGGTFHSEYNKDFGSASIVMTGNPGQLMITTNQNKCEKRKCEKKIFKNELNYSIFRFSYFNEDEKTVIYSGRLVPFRAHLASITFPKGYEETLAKNDIIITADKDPNLPSGSLLKTDRLVMKIIFEDQVQIYHLKKTAK